GGLFGFVAPGQATPDLRERALAQLTALFGPEAAKATRIDVADWSQDPFTATPADLGPPGGHPHYTGPRALDPLGRILLAGTESAPMSGGFLEGALEAAELAVEQAVLVSA
ncbi:MAG: FAD-dependent oxidoreductase, partial [Pseudomonadota bacterium]